MEAALREWATQTDGGLAVRAGAGAGGGIGFGLMLLGANRVNGTELVADAAGLGARAHDADLAVTATAVFDWEVLRGRVVVAVARAAQAAGRPTVVLAERVDVGRRELSNAGVDAAYAVADAPGSDETHTPAERLAALAQRVARTWSH
jgi:glycerate kinase